jgi:hypothetical protein
MRLPETMTAPTFLLKQVERVETTSATDMKYSSQEGRMLVQTSPSKQNLQAAEIFIVMTEEIPRTT